MGYLRVSEVSGAQGGINLSDLSYCVEKVPPETTLIKCPPIRELLTF